MIILINYFLNFKVKIVQLMKETKFAVERHERKAQEEAAQKQAILDSKLKPKGHKLIHS